MSGLICISKDAGGRNRGSARRYAHVLARDCRASRRPPQQPRASPARPALPALLALPPYRPVDPALLRPCLFRLPRTYSRPIHYIDSNSDWYATSVQKNSIVRLILYKQSFMLKLPTHFLLSYFPILFVLAQP